MNKDVSKQIHQEMAQYRLEVQNNELKSEIQVAHDAIAAQNRYTANMSNIITILGIGIAIFGIIIPAIMTYKSYVANKELQEIKTNVDDFITNKFVEWERKDIDRVLNAFMDGSLDLNGYKAALRLRQPPLDHIEKIFEKLFSKFDSKTELKETALVGGSNVSQFLSYIFVDLEDTNSEELKTIRNKIVSSEWFFSILNQVSPIRPKVGAKMFKCFFDTYGQQKIIDLINNIEQSRDFWLLIRMAQSELFDIDNESKKEIYGEIAKRILSEEPSLVSLASVQNNKQIIDVILEADMLANAKIRDTGQKSVAFAIADNNSWTSIDKESYLAEKIRERMGD